MPTRYANDREVLQRVTELREAHMPMRQEIAVRQAVGLAYANGKQWTVPEATVTGNVIVDSWSEDWNPRSHEIRVVDNKTGPLVRKVASSTNATRIEASVTPPKHRRTLESSKQATVSQDILNGIESDAGFTLAARRASSLRWVAGSSIIVVRLSKKKHQIDANIARNPDGSPVEINDQWVRWDSGCICDLIWDVSNYSPDLESHDVLVHEEVMTARRFVQIYGDLDQYGLSMDELPTIGELAPYYVTAGNITGTSIFASYARMSKEKAVRVLTLIESDPRDPGHFTELYTIVDTSPTSSNGAISGKVVNFDNPYNCFGHHGRNVFKLDAFRRDDAFWAFGIPHVVMGQQDMTNIARSIQFQQMTAAVYGHWLIDRQTSDPDEFANSLAEGIGGVLTWDSRQQQHIRPPQWISPQAPNQEFISISSDLAIGMRDAVHLSAANLGIGKTHIPEGIQRMLLQEAGSVVDTIIERDKGTYADALKLTLGTIRKAMDSPNRMLARLRDQYDFGPSDLMQFMEVDPHYVKLDVTVRESSIITRSSDERKAELNGALQLQAISAMDVRIALAEELELPLVKIDEMQLAFIKRELIRVINGDEWVGLPSVDFPMFKHVVRMAIYGLDLDRPEHVQAMARLERAIVIQQAVSMELDPNSAFQGGTAPPAPMPSQPFDADLLPDLRGGAPESINPVTSPTGASGGLPLGLPASVA